jgi:hypothetical protein
VFPLPTLMTFARRAWEYGAGRLVRSFAGTDRYNSSGQDHPTNIPYVYSRIPDNTIRLSIMPVEAGEEAFANPERSGIPTQMFSTWYAQLLAAKGSKLPDGVGGLGCHCKHLGREVGMMVNEDNAFAGVVRRLRDKGQGRQGKGDIRAITLAGVEGEERQGESP